ncbi:MAG: ornithine carbamoyltransferase [Desulfobacter sp.]|uniref:ornithine carbamoyltransferase n=1 Tax=Desulfobacter sp. TaxID=2294 RepID=UPI001B7373FD|nr:ornithine carbamoyltransferase [Desulfobacter sp.]MBP8830107.1 ornithine carbamoyltransferase [Desulfobacter sp.]HRF89242.1 ornithine carbamoyltransferase [Desulfobacter postgatei]
MKKDLLCLLDLEPQDFIALFERALSLKERHKKGIFDSVLAGKTLGLIFDKKSTRTRIAFETAMIQLGGHSIYMSTQDTQISRNEPAKDTARVLSRYIDCLAMRTFDHHLVEEFAQSSTIPVINALTDAYHPCQILSDIMTVIEHKGGYENVRIAWVGDGNNVANSWVNAASVLGLELMVACPDNHHIKPDIIAASGADTKKNIVFTNDPKEAVKGADVVYTDVWASMGEEDQLEGRLKTFKGFQVNEELLKGAKDDCLVLHCLPAHRGEEIAESVFEAKNAAFWDQAENKRHMHKAILECLILG